MADLKDESRSGYSSAVIFRTVANLDDETLTEIQLYMLPTWFFRFEIFSDSGIPVVLLMENYDISCSGYHDSLDTLAEIDLDYGSALATIAIETVA